jgi:tRNA-splicing ligase RtcB (3'-phosphate/5'-hydroxy nucleic acid ligase)
MAPKHVNDKLVNFASIIEPSTLDQAVVTSCMPFIHPHVALMPDAHLGKGATVGSVIPTLGAIIPAAVGVDIGCGMMAVRTQFSGSDLRAGISGDLEPDHPWSLQALHASIARRIPLSAGRYNEHVDGVAAPRLSELMLMDGVEQANDVSRNWTYQLGSLGSGNHFIEVSLDELDRVWLFLHSGSRGVGNKLAQRHIKIAQEQCKRRFIPLPDPDLAYLVDGEPEFWAYMEALRWAQRFAFLNREVMMDRVMDAFTEWIGANIVREEVINCHHNYTVLEKHFGQTVWLSRKGAIDAHEGVPGLIPGSMGAASYVVTGKGNRVSLCSSPHGAGRNFSRSAARKRFTRDDLDGRMKGIVWGESDAFLDEHPDAYKPIDVVMDDAADLVQVDHTLRQIVNVKGD